MTTNGMYHEYTGQAQIAHLIDVDFTVAIPHGSTKEQSDLLMKAAAEAAAVGGAGSESRCVVVHNFSRGLDIGPPAVAE